MHPNTIRIYGDEFGAVLVKKVRNGDGEAYIVAVRYHDLPEQGWEVLAEHPSLEDAIEHFEEVVHMM